MRQDKATHLGHCGMPAPTCGISSKKVTQDPKEVTCNRCRGTDFYQDAVELRELGEYDD